MSDGRRSIVFVTNELFLPTPHNGSCGVYLGVAQDYARKGYDIFCLSFFRDGRRACDPDVLSRYASLFSGFLLIPGRNGGGTLIGTISLGLREISRWISGNIFSTSPLLKSILKESRAEIVEFIRQRDIRTVYFHKLDTMLLLRDILPNLRPATLILDLHDDFVEREIQYRRAYNAFFSKVGPKAIVKEYLRLYLRYRFSRLNVDLSRNTETDLLAECDQILINSQEEYKRYQLRVPLAGKLVHWHWPLWTKSGRPGGIPQARFHAGLIGSDDVFNLDALLWFCDEILPRIRRLRPDFQLLIAGSIVRKAARLVGGRDQVTIWASLDDVTTFYNSIVVAVAPVRYGTGTCIKVLEALSFGCPVITTSVGVRGIPSEDLIGTCVADDPETFAARVVKKSRGLLPIVHNGAVVPS